MYFVSMWLESNAEIRNAEMHGIILSTDENHVFWKKTLRKSQPYSQKIF